MVALFTIRHPLFKPPVSNVDCAALPQPRQSSPLLSVEDGIRVVAIDGPFLPKPDIIARDKFRATDS